MAVGDEPLRLNTYPVPQDAMPVVVGDHAARVAAAVEWLSGLCGDYAPLRRQFIVGYFRAIAGQLDARRDDLVERLKPYDGLYAPDDFLWAALMPLPRGWVPVGDRLLPADMVFWDGTQPIAIELAVRPTERETALRAAGACVHRLEPVALAEMQFGTFMPELCRRFWEGRRLPSSPFRRAIPLGVVAECT